MKIFILFMVFTRKPKSIGLWIYWTMWNVLIGKFWCTIYDEERVGRKAIDEIEKIAIKEEKWTAEIFPDSGISFFYLHFSKIERCNGRTRNNRLCIRPPHLRNYYNVVYFKKLDSAGVILVQGTKTTTKNHGI